MRILYFLGYLGFKIVILHYFDAIDSDSSSWFVFFIFFSLGNLIHNVHAIDDLTKDRMFAI